MFRGHPKLSKFIDPKIYSKFNISTNTIPLFSCWTCSSCSSGKRSVFTWLKVWSLTPYKETRRNGFLGFFGKNHKQTSPAWNRKMTLTIWCPRKGNKRKRNIAVVLFRNQEEVWNVNTVKSIFFDFHRGRIQYTSFKRVKWP